MIYRPEPPQPVVPAENQGNNQPHNDPAPAANNGGNHNPPQNPAQGQDGNAAPNGP